MDLNQLYFRQHLPAMRTCAAKDHGHQIKHQTLVDEQGREIAAFQKTLDAPAATTWPILRSFPAFRLPILE